MNERDEELRAEAYAMMNAAHTVVQHSPYRQQFHIMPPVGLLRNPTGLYQKDGVYHIFYQWMPFKTAQGATFLAHVSTNDWVHFSSVSIAVTPSDFYDKDGCYGGSVLVEGEDTYLFYTGSAEDEHGLRTMSQCIANVKHDGTVEKGGMVLPMSSDYTECFQNPKVWKKDDMYYMVVGTQSHKSEGKVAFYGSKTLREWTHMGAIAGSNFQEDIGFGYMWECPDFFQVDDTDVLIAAPQGLEPFGMKNHNVYQVYYFLGTLHYEKPEFEDVFFDEMDRGFEFYAPQTFLNERNEQVVIGWMGVPTQDEEQHPTIEQQWIHCLTIPRTLRVENMRLRQQPLVELKKLRGEVTIEKWVETEYEAILTEKAFEWIVTFENTSFEDWTLTLHDCIKLHFHSEEQVFTLKRKKIDGSGDWEHRQCFLEELEKLHLFVDVSSIEVFINDGEEVFTARMFPTNYGRVRMEHDGSAKISSERYVLCEANWNSSLF